MTALTADRNTEYSLGDLLSVPVAAGQTVYGGSIVCLNAAGYAVPGADTDGLLVVGVATARADNSAGSDGDASVVVRRRGRFRFESASALDQSALGARVYVADDQTVAAVNDVANDVPAGVIDRVEADGAAWVAIDAEVLSGRTWNAPSPTTTAAA
ncbi:MAG: hypothetical protein ACOC7T_01295 [Planctomycetota bacterium]